jgi:hypothetical protein
MIIFWFQLPLSKFAVIGDVNYNRSTNFVHEQYNETTQYSVV